MSIYVLDNQKEYRYINDTWIEIINDLSQIHGHDNKDVLDKASIKIKDNYIYGFEVGKNIEETINKLKKGKQ